MHADGLRLRVHDPGQPGAGGEVLDQLAGDLGLGVALADHLDGQVGADRGVTFAATFIASEPAARDERDVRSPHQAGDEPQHAVGTQDRAELAGLDEIHDEASNQDCDRGFFPSHGFLHQGAVDQLADGRAELALVVADEVLLGGRAGRGMEADAMRRDVPQAPEQVGQGLGVLEAVGHGETRQG